MKNLFRTRTLQMLLLAGLTLCTNFAHAQIPNWGFEAWTDHSKEMPSGWTAFGGITKIIPGATGNFCLRLSGDSANANEGFGAILYGIPKEQGMAFEGGIPFAARPDSIKVNMKYQVAAGDSAWILVQFKKNGVMLSMDIFKITGTQTTFTTRAFMINYFGSGIPDSLILAFTSTDPEGQSNPASVVYVDDISFTGTSVVVPNGDLESWVVKSYYTPDGWSAYANDYNESNITRTTDAVGGSYAIKIETFIERGDSGSGYSTTMKPGSLPWSSFGPAFPVSLKPDTFCGYFKYAPQNGDSCHIQVNMFQLGNMVGYGYFASGSNVSTYTPFKCRIQYGPGALPDSAAVTLSTYYMGPGPHRSLGASVLYVDNLSFNQLINTGISESKSPVTNQLVFPNPVQHDASVRFNLATDERVRISVLDMSGREMMGIFNNTLSRGTHEFSFDLSALAGGMYMVQLQTGSSLSFSKIIVSE